MARGADGVILDRATAARLLTDAIDGVELASPEVAAELREALLLLIEPEAQEEALAAARSVCGVKHGRLACDRPPHRDADHSWAVAVYRQRLGEYETAATITLPATRRKLAAATTAAARHRAEADELREAFGARNERRLARARAAAATRG